MAYKGSFYDDEYDYENYHDSLDYDTEDEHLPTLNDVLLCGFSVSKPIAIQLAGLLFVNFVYRLIRQSNIPEIFKHLSSFSLGYLSTFIFFSTSKYILFLAFISYAFLKLLRLTGRRKQGFYVIAFQIVLIFTCEIFELSGNWQHLRGSALIISMKAISIAFDITSSKIAELPSILEYFGYALCPANIELGPFFPFSSYKDCQKNNNLSLKLLLQVTINCLLSIVFIILSSCFLNYLISDNFIIMATYRDALIYRCSHYFISFMSSAALLVSGIDSNITPNLFGYQVTKPLDIELPRSLIPVVISWNIPIHMWVKTYIFRNLRQFGRFTAILLTYLISASLHGLNFQLAAVLLSIGVFTFVEHRFRNVLAEILDACVAANKCNLDSESSCTSRGHLNTSTLLWVKMINFAFGVFTIVLLAYLGVLLDTSIDQSNVFSWEQVLKKWIDLKFFGHIIVLIWETLFKCQHFYDNAMNEEATKMKKN